MNTISPTEAYIGSLFSSEELKPVLNLVPEVFIDQARDAAASFYVDSSLLSRSQYMPEDGSCDLIRIVLEEPSYDDGIVQVRCRISGIMNSEGELIPHKTGATLKADETRISGFRSGTISFDENSIINGVISRADFEILVGYADLWSDLIENYGDDAPYTKEHGNKRLWLVATTSNALFTFQMVTRQNPRTKAYTVGISDVAWRNMSLIGAGTGGRAEAAKAAADVGFSKPTLKLPKFERGAGVSNVSVSRRRNRR